MTIETVEFIIDGKFEEKASLIYFDIVGDISVGKVTGKYTKTTDGPNYLYLIQNNIAGNIHYDASKLGDKIKADQQGYAR